MFAQLKQKKLQQQKLKSQQQYPSPRTHIAPSYRQISPSPRQNITAYNNTYMRDSATIISGTSRTKLHQCNEVIIPRLSNIKRKEVENVSPANYHNQTSIKNMCHQNEAVDQQGYRRGMIGNKEQLESRSKSPSLRLKNIELNQTVKPSKSPKNNYQCDESVITLTRKPTIKSQDFSEIEEYKQKQSKTLICGNYLHQHPSINYKARAILLDWMMELSNFYHLHRETYYIAVNMVDSYLSVISNMPLHYFQLLGATALFIATKHEEYEPLVASQLVNATNQTFSEEDFLKMEVLLLKGLKFNIRTLTYTFWVGYYVEKWVQFEVSNTDKQSTKDRNMLHRVMHSIIGIAQLDIESLSYQPRQIIASLLLLLICLLSQSLDIEQIQYSLPYSSKYLLTSTDSVMLQFKRFLSSNFNMKMNDLVESIQFISSYFFVCESINMDEEFSVDLQSFRKGSLRMVQFRQQFVAEAGTGEDI